MNEPDRTQHDRAGEQWTSEEWVRDKKRFVTDAEETAAQPQPPARDHEYPLGPLGQQFARLTSSLLDAGTVGQVLEQVVVAAKRLFPAADVVSVTLRGQDGHFHTPVQSDPVASALDDLQYRFREGPCVQAADPHGPALAVCDDLRAEPRWPRWAPAALALGVHSVMATALIPEPIPPQRSGALNIFSYHPHGLAEIDRDQVLLLATHASLALAHTDALTQAALRETHLRRAIDSRDVIGQAKGIIMHRRGVSAAQAFDILRAASQRLNIKLVEIAETLATRHTALDQPDTGFEQPSERCS